MTKRDECNTGSEIVLYQAEDRGPRIEVRLESGTVWLSQAQLAELYQTTVANINLHLKVVYAEGELASAATIKFGLIVRSEGGQTVRRQVKHYTWKPSPLHLCSRWRPRMTSVETIVGVDLAGPVKEQDQ